MAQRAARGVAVHFGAMLFLFSSLSSGLVSNVASAQVEFVDRFDRADGPLEEGWTIAGGAWRIESSALRAGPATAGAEQHAYAGSPAIAFPPGNASISVGMEFSIPDGGPGVGRHAGVILCMDAPGTRVASSGYLIWWIDRAEDRGINLERRDGGVFTKLASGTAGAEDEPPSELSVEIDGATIIAFADGVEVLRVDDETYRGGYFGLWTWEGAAQELRFDDFEVSVSPDPLRPCFEVDPIRPAPGVVTRFDASCSEAFLGAITSWSWNFGDGGTAQGEVANYTYDFPDVYIVTLTVRDGLGNVATAEREVQVAESCLPLADDFGQAGGLPEDWTILSGAWEVDGAERLHILGSGEDHIWAGDPPCPIGGDVTIQFDVEFHAAPQDGVGRHASVFFFAEEPILRWQTRAYSVWWIDRPDDFGMGLHEWTGGGLRQIGDTSGTTMPALRDPPKTWTITVEGSRITCYGGCFRILEVEDDSVPRDGFFGFWAYSNGQDVTFDNVSVRSGVFPPTADPACGAQILLCAEATPERPKVGDEIVFDASCSQVPPGIEITYRWDFGDGVSATGEVVEHRYLSAGRYSIELTGTPVGGGAPQTQTIEVTVSDVASGDFCEDFGAAPPGAEVPGFTVFGGNWSITDDGKLLGESGGGIRGGEGHIWIGDPPILFSGDLTIEFDIEFLNHVGDQGGAVGKHAGLFFFADEPINRWDLDAYDVWWIDRTQDFGLGLHRWQPLTFLSPGTGIEHPELELLDPPERWRVEVEGDAIRVFGDGELLVESFDATYREGHIGFWVYLNDQRVLFDNISITPAGAAGCTGPAVRPCFTVDTPGDASTPSVGEAASFDAGCSVVREGVTVTAYRWSFGDGGSANGASVEHIYTEPGEYEVVLSIEYEGGAEPARLTRRISVVAVLPNPFFEDFDRADGVPEGWTVASGNWSIVDGALEVETTAAGEATIWLGDPPLVARGPISFEFSVDFINHDPIPADAIGRHAGVLFYAAAPTDRWSTTLYDVWWIDRDLDYGLGSHLFRGGAIPVGTPGTLDLLDDPPSRWRVEVDGDAIRVFGDDEFLYELVDTERREGHIGFWAYSNAQKLRFDDLCIVRGVSGGPPDCAAQPGGGFVRGDADANGTRNITDAIAVLNFLFLGGATPSCRDAADVDDSGSINITDGISLLGFLFLGGAAPPPPTAACGEDPSADALECLGFAPCAGG
jgi:PKD repeat protein